MASAGLVTSSLPLLGGVLARRLASLCPVLARDLSSPGKPTTLAAFVAVRIVAVALGSLLRRAPLRGPAVGCRRSADAVPPRAEAGAAADTSLRPRDHRGHRPGEHRGRSYDERCVCRPHVNRLPPELSPKSSRGPRNVVNNLHHGG